MNPSVFIYLGLIVCVLGLAIFTLPIALFILSVLLLFGKHTILGIQRLWFVYVNWKDDQRYRRYVDYMNNFK